MPLSVTVLRKSMYRIATFAIAACGLVATLEAQPGVFLPTVTYDSGAPCTDSIALADINADGKPDLVIGGGYVCLDQQPTHGYVNILFGNGDGTFKPPVTYYSGGAAVVSVQIADVNGDGKLDLVVANVCTNDPCTEAAVGVLLGNGDGSFQPPIPAAGGPGASSIAIADVNGDGKPDLVLNGEYAVGVMLGNGNGTFQPVVTYPSGAIGANSVVVADVNHDGKPDIVVANGGSDFSPDGVVGILLGRGDGTFEPVVIYDSGGAASVSIGVADVDGDGNTDILVLNECISNGNCATGSVGVLLGKGDGTFQPGVGYASGAPGATSLTIGDVSGDGKLDLAVAHCAPKGSGCPGRTGVVGVLLGNGDGTFQPVDVHSSGGVAANSIAIGDVNGDGQADLVVANHLGESNNDGTVGVLLHNNKTHHSTSISLHANLNPSFCGQSVTFTALVSSLQGPIPDGELVTFFDGETAIAQGTTSGGTAAFSTALLSVKTHAIRATYSGDATFKPSTKAVQQVVKKYGTGTILISDPNPSSSGKPVTFTATVTSEGPAIPTGSVRFMDGSKTLNSVTLSNGIAIFSDSKLTVGTHPITASYLGDNSSEKSSSQVLDQVVK